MSSGLPGNRSTPRQLGYRWPAEWEPHEGTWLAWPHNTDTWPGTFDQIPPIFQQLVETLLQWEPVHLLAAEPEIATAAHGWLDRLAASATHPLRWHDIGTNDAWIRDYGPTFLLPATGKEAGSKPIGIDWPYNAWGDKYPPYELDRQAASEVLEQLQIECFRPPLLLEGGAIDGNGAGTLVTTESCILNPNRNPGWTRTMAEEIFSDYLSVDQVIWINGQILAGDDTDGHVDQLVRFVGPATVVAAHCEDQHDPSFQPLTENLHRLQETVLVAGQALQVITLPLPAPVTHGEHRLPASYCNFLIANGGLIVPQFDDPNDQLACAILQDCFPDREVVGLPSRALVWGLGTVHCLSQQQPAMTPREPS